MGACGRTNVIEEGNKPKQIDIVNTMIKSIIFIINNLFLFI